jgi:hypothetical protein
MWSIGIDTPEEHGRQGSQRDKAAEHNYAVAAAVAPVNGAAEIETAPIQILFDTLQQWLRQRPPLLFLHARSYLPALERMLFRFRFWFGLRRMLR